MNFSVAMCTFNGADFLSSQLESLAAQTLKPTELIISDDGSTDSTQSILREFAAQAPFPVSIHINSKTLGVVENFERAIGLCSGDLIALCDQDDVWDPGKLQVLADAFRQTSEPGLVFSNGEIVDHNLQPLGTTLWQVFKFDEEKRKLLSLERFEFLVPGWTVTGATLAFRSKYRELCLPIPRNLPMIHDGWIALAIAAVAPVVAINETLIKYRRHQKQQIGVPDYSTRELRRSMTSALQYQPSYSELARILTTLRERLLANRTKFDCQNGLQRTEQYLKHVEKRAAMRSLRFGRVPAVFRELASRRYHEYSNGFRSAAKDLLSLRMHSSE